MEQAPTRDVGGLGDVVQRRRLEAALQKQANGLGLNPGMGLGALTLTQANCGGVFLHCLHYCTVCSITRYNGALPRDSNRRIANVATWTTSNIPKIEPRALDFRVAEKLRGPSERLTGVAFH
jgi:hypothetical protein